MSRRSLTARARLAALAVVAWVPLVAHADTEEDLLARLRSSAPTPIRAEACKELRLVGTSRSVATLAPLLTTHDERLAHAARYALEGMPFPEAAAALREALPQAPATLRIGLIDSLGWRRDPAAIPSLAQYLLDTDDAHAAAAAAALGRIGGDRARSVLDAARERVPGRVARAVREALLGIAEQFLAGDDSEAAARIYRSLQAPLEDESVRQAAFAGEIRAAKERGADLIRSALQSSDPAAQAAALRLAGEPDSPMPIPVLANLVPGAPAPVRIGLLAALQRRGDPAALPAVAAEAQSPDPAIRLAAVVALATLGDASVVAGLVEAAASVDARLQSAARDALGMVPRGDVPMTLVSLLPKATPSLAREIFRALGSRGEPASVRELIRLARNPEDRFRGLALQTLTTTANTEDLPALVELALTAHDPDSRDGIRGVFESLIERRGLAGGPPIDPLVHRLGSGSASEQQALLPIAALFVDDRVRANFRSSLASTNEPLRSAAVLALAGTRDPRLLADLLSLAANPEQAPHRPALLRGIVRLATDEAVAMPAASRAQTLVSAYALAQSNAEKSIVIAGLSRSDQRSALEAALRAAAEAPLTAEAQQAALRIAQRLGSTEFDFVEATVTQLATHAVDPAIRTEAAAVLQRLDSGWRVSGPYRLEGKEAQALFEHPFPPEHLRSPALPWRRVPGQADPARVGEVDLGEFAGGNHCVLYAQSRLVSPAEREVTLAIGSDDGIQLWLNGQRIHANNAVRGLVPGQDRVRAHLRAGPNDVLAKITQHTAGCGLRVDVLGADGHEVPGLKWESPTPPQPLP